MLNHINPYLDSLGPLKNREGSKLRLCFIGILVLILMCLSWLHLNDTVWFGVYEEGDRGFEFEYEYSECQTRKWERVGWVSWWCLNCIGSVGKFITSVVNDVVILMPLKYSIQSGCRSRWQLSVVARSPLINRLFDYILLVHKAECLVDICIHLNVFDTCRSFHFPLAQHTFIMKSSTNLGVVLAWDSQYVLVHHLFHCLASLPCEHSILLTVRFPSDAYE